MKLIAIYVLLWKNNDFVNVFFSVINIGPNTYIEKKTVFFSICYQFINLSKILKKVIIKNIMLCPKNPL